MKTENTGLPPFWADAVKYVKSNPTDINAPEYENRANDWIAGRLTERKNVIDMLEAKRHVCLAISHKNDLANCLEGVLFDIIEDYENLYR